jgi:hypothetical protein
MMNLRKYILRRGVDEPVSGMCPLVGFSISAADP